MSNHHRPRVARLLAALGLMLALAVLAACGGTPGDTGAADTTGDAGGTQATAEVRTTGFDELGDVKLKVWADAGEEATMRRLIPRFEQQYPNVDVELSLHAFDDHIKTVVNAMAANDAPDLAQGGHGFLTDGALVRGGLVEPLDRYSDAYGWEDRFGAPNLSYMRWSDGGAAFGEGELFGISPITELVGMYYDKQLLRRLGDAAPPRTLDELETVLARAKAAGIQPIALGNADKYPATHVFGLLHGQEQAPAEVRDWIAGKAGATFDNAGTRKAAERMVRWARAGYFGSDFNGTSADDAVARFTNGRALFLLAGTWNAPAIAEAMRDGAGYANFPLGTLGKPASPGGPGLPWHISAKSENKDLAAAFLAMLHSREFLPELVAVDRPPAQPGAQAEGLLADVIAAVDAELAAGGAMGSYDHTSATMIETMGGRMQELLAGRTDVDGFVGAVQDDWSEAREK